MPGSTKQAREDADCIIHSAREYASYLKQNGQRPRLADYEYYKHRLHSVNIYEQDSRLAAVLGV